MRLTLRCGFAAALALVASGGVSAQTPPIKPGLWQMKLQHDDPELQARMREMEARMKDMPPEQRKQFEAMLKHHGVGMSGPDTMKMCLTQEDIASDAWQSHLRESGCKTDTTKSGSTWKIRSTCPAPEASETDGEVNFLSDERYTMQSTTTMSEGGKKRTVRMTGDATWLGAHCGDLKPVPQKKK